MVDHGVAEVKNYSFYKQDKIKLALHSQVSVASIISRTCPFLECMGNIRGPHRKRGRQVCDYRMACKAFLRDSY